jgi:hypothetical protein
MSRRNRSAGAVLHEWLLPAPERRAARAERRVEAAMRRERESEHTPERRAAALEAEARRYDFLVAYGHRSGMRGARR